MKPIMLASLVFLLAISACGQPISNPVQIPAETDWITFTTGSFTVDLPSTWVEEASSDEQVIYAVSAGTASLWIKSWPLIPGLVSKSVHDWVDGNEAVSLLSESRGSDEIHLELALTEGFRVMRLSTLLIYCDAKAYEVTGTALERDFKRYKAIIDQTHSSAVCQPPERYPDLDSGALGMVIIPPAVDGNDFDPAAYQESLALARKNGVQVSHYYFHWGDIEVEPGIYDWTVPDYILEANALEGLQLSIVVSVIHTTVRGRIPSDLRDRSFDDPVFIQRLSDFLSAFAERYKGHLHYLAIGNEVNNYFADHRDQIPAYASAFDRARTAIHTVNPGLPVGIIFAYHL